MSVETERNDVFVTVEGKSPVSPLSSPKPGKKKGLLYRTRRRFGADKVKVSDEEKSKPPPDNETPDSGDDCTLPMEVCACVRPCASFASFGEAG